MKRRNVLASMGGVLSITTGGCLTGDSDTGPHFAVTAADVPEERPLHHDITIQQSNIRSSEAPLTVETSLTNETERSLIYGEGRFIFGLYHTSNDFQLLPQHEPYEFNTNHDIWQAPVPIGFDDEYITEEIDPIETHTKTVVLVATNDTDLSETIPPEFTFEITFESGELQEAEMAEIRYEWSFTLHET